MIQPSERTFSKRLVFLCIALAWAALFYSIYNNQASVAIAGFSFIAALGGTYMGIGHMDLRSLLMSLRQNSDTSTITYDNPSEGDNAGS